MADFPAMDVLTVLNDALAATGNSTIEVLNDGSDEYLVANRALERAIRDLASRHNWPFGRASMDLVPADLTAITNPSKVYSVAYDLEEAVFQVARVLVVNPTSGLPALLEDYQIMGRRLWCDYDQGVSIEYVTTPNDADWHPQAAEILTLYVQAGCMAGLNEDFAEARQCVVAAETRLFEARPRVDRQNPAQNAFLSSTAIARRTRRGGSGETFGA